MTSNGAKAEQAPCLILVGGLGTRLRPVISDIPKPMAPISGKPFLEYLIQWIAGSGLRRLVLCTGYRAEVITKYFGRGEQWGVDITYSLESEPLGTWGAVRQAMNNLAAEHFVVLNGDSFLQIELKTLVDFHLSKQALATLALIEVGEVSRFGSVRAASDDRITEFREKGGAGPALINGGVYCLSRRLLMVADEAAHSLERDVFPALIGRGLYGMRVQGEFFDIGVPEEYSRVVADAKNWISRFNLPAQAENKC
jgi:NDP-sugar pyrophosphorylase family protein